LAAASHDRIHRVPHNVGKLESLGFRLLAAGTLEEVARAALDGRAQLHAVLDSMRSTILVTDDEGRIVFLNSAAGTLLGVSPEEVYGSPISRFFPDWPCQEATPPLAVHRADGAIVPVVAELSQVMIGDRRLQMVVLHDAAQEAWIGKGQALAEPAFRDASNEWRATFDALGSLTLIVDVLGQVQRLNRAAANAAGRDFRDCLGRKIGDLGAGQPWRTMAAIAAENPDDAVSIQVQDSKTGLSWEVTGVRMDTGDRTSSRIILSARDNTVLVELESSVRRWEKMAAIGELTAGVAHEVRNPLFAISAGLDALATILKDEGKVANLISLMRREVTRLKRLMEDLLAYGKPGTPTQLTDEPVSSAIDLGVRSCESQAQTAGVSIALRGDDGPWLVRMDRERLSQVVANLVENAIHHSPGGGTVIVEIEGFERDRRRWIRCTTRDSGLGFQEADIPRLFEPFFSRRAGGTGLGLSIALRIIDQHGGAISARNRAEGGAEVAFELPCVRTRAPASADPSS
jgi:signal transduction histidine kinase